MQDILVTWNRLRQDDENEDHWWKVRVVDVEEEYESAQKEYFSMKEAMIQRRVLPLLTAPPSLVKNV